MGTQNFFLTGTRKFFVVPRWRQEEKHLSQYVNYVVKFSLRFAPFLFFFLSRGNSLTLMPSPSYFSWRGKNLISAQWSHAVTTSWLILVKYVSIYVECERFNTTDKFESIQKRFSKRKRKPGRNSEAKVKSVSCNEDYPHAPYAHTFPSVVMETK